MLITETKGSFVIQDRRTGKYLQHDGTGQDHPYNDVRSTEDATIWQTLEHVSYVLWWYVDSFGDYRIINLDTDEHYVKNKKRGMSHVMKEAKVTCPVCGTSYLKPGFKRLASRYYCNNVNKHHGIRYNLTIEGEEGQS
ncbi:hypothetical protein [Paenibacillus illinoisensis]|uniref:hypothetical protein n=1 Tax=Paenibacillus illinoisensis TaxID=59845 RepID=UPI00203A9E02|nr:hypothetical protein [Paenibacillus illinoisensis]MCM3208513.1 hypothetical protein [Paenibacillus illinoisensis]